MTRWQRSRSQPQFVPALDAWPDAGVYRIWLELSARVTRKIGALGYVSLPPGWYVYTGRAARALVARVRRHLRRAKRAHWHIDFLLAAPTCRVRRVVLASRCAADECRVHQAMGRMVRSVVPGFGASDCRSGCGAHLACIEPATGTRWLRRGWAWKWYRLQRAAESPANDVPSLKKGRRAGKCRTLSPVVKVGTANLPIESPSRATCACP